jgi:SAM-dependent methyltransferase
MTFEECIDPFESGTNLLVEHLIRYEFVSQMTAQCSPTYFDLGCGNGFGLKVLQYHAPASILYGCDISEKALARAASYLGTTPPVRLLQMDLRKAETYCAVESLLKAHQEGPRVLLCFEVLEHLDRFESLVAFIDRQVEKGVEAFLSVPNDSFWGVQNPFHKSMFGEESLSELTQLFSARARLYKQYPLQGATVLPDGVSELSEDKIVGKLFPEFLARRQGLCIPSHFIFHFGSTDVEIGRFTACFAPWDAAAERQWAAQRESDMLYYREARRVKGELKGFQESLQKRSSEGPEG